MKKLLVVVIFIILFSCKDSTTKNKEKTYSGIVKLIELDNNELVSDDVDIVVFKKNIDDITWDYRLEKPILVTKTNDNGEFSFECVPNSNLVVYPLYQGYSIDEYKLSNFSSEIQLYENITISGTITDNIVTNGNRDLVIKDNVMFVQGSSLVIGEDTKIRINSGNKITLFSQVSFSKNISIVSSDQAYTWDNTEVKQFDFFIIEKDCIVSNNSISNVNITDSNNGFILKCGDITLKSMKIINSNYGLCLIDSGNYQIENLVAENVKGPNGVVYFFNSYDSSLSKSNINKSSIGLKSYQSACINIENTKIMNCSYGLIYDCSTGEMINNSLASNSIRDMYIDFHLISGNLFIQNNIFMSKEGIRQKYYYNDMGSVNEKIFNNNFYSKICFRIDKNRLYDDIDCSNNYFDGCYSYEDIKAKVNYYGEDGVHDIIVEPFRTQPVPGAGIED